MLHLWKGSFKVNCLNNDQKNKVSSENNLKLIFGLKLKIDTKLSWSQVNLSCCGRCVWSAEGRRRRLKFPSCCYFMVRSCADVTCCVYLCSKKKVVYTYRLLQTHTGYYTLTVNTHTHTLTARKGFCCCCFWFLIRSPSAKKMSKQSFEHFCITLDKINCFLHSESLLLCFSDDDANSSAAITFSYF